jgi:hypothetical protein
MISLAMHCFICLQKRKRAWLCCEGAYNYLRYPWREVHTLLLSYVCKYLVKDKFELWIRKRPRARIGDEL